MVGPLVSDKALARVQAFVDDARASGATVVLGGERCGGELANGNFWPPTIITGVTNTDPLCCDEVFGPVVAVMPFDTEEEVVALANDTRFGLAGGVWTQDLNKALRVSKRVHTGTMWVNTWLMITPGAPFGGVGHSGVGREGGEEAVREFTETKTVHIGGVF
jgi:acyl-CoA reductase-like NAD-dependent aldehyde dehydrogenase